MTEIKRHKFDELYTSYYKTPNAAGITAGPKTVYTLFERRYDTNGREMMEPQKMVAVQQEGNIIVLYAEEFSEKFLKQLTEWDGKMSDQAISGLGEVPRK